MLTASNGKEYAVCAAILLGLCWSLSSVEGIVFPVNDADSNHFLGVEFLLRGESGGRLLITDISLHNGSISTSDEEALVCRSRRNVAELHSSPRTSTWYTDPEVNTTNASGEMITGRNEKH